VQDGFFGWLVSGKAVPDGIIRRLEFFKRVALKQHAVRQNAGGLSGACQAAREVPQMSAITLLARKHAKAQDPIIRVFLEVDPSAPTPVRER
jgi:hypothetical protein